MWIDSHCHLNDEAFNDDLAEVVEKAIAAGVGAINVVGFDLPSSRRALELSRRYELIWATVGVHPHDADSWNSDTIKELQEMLAERKVVAVGETGLDYHYDYSAKESQRRAFREQLLIAGQYNKPVVIHSREATLDTMTILAETGLGAAGGVMHCFGGGKETAEQCLQMGLDISFAGPLTFNNSRRLREAATEIPLTRLLVETDSPYLTPEPLRGRRNEPALVKLVGRKLAEIKGISETELMAVLAANFASLFKISSIGK